MNSEQITAFLQEHWYIASVLIGAVILIGACLLYTSRGETTQVFSEKRRKKRGSEP